jgi:prepilin-type N-terminal cleavage/methylation domain-containing protein
VHSTSRPAGFTLIEVVVSMTLAATASMAVLLALRSGFTIWDRGADHLDRLHRTRVVHELLYDQIRGAMPFAHIVKQPERFIPLEAFEGGRNYIRFVSRSSFKDGPNGIPRWVEIRWLRNSQDETGNLTAEERRILSPDNKADSNIYTRENLFQANDCSFDFLKSGSPMEPPAWTLDWQPPKDATLPRAVRLTCFTEANQVRTIIPLDYAASSAAGLLLR